MNFIQIFMSYEQCPFYEVLLPSLAIFSWQILTCILMQQIKNFTAFSIAITLNKTEITITCRQIIKYNTYPPLLWQISSAEKISFNVAPFFYHHSVMIQHLVSDRILSLISNEDVDNVRSNRVHTSLCYI